MQISWLASFLFLKNKVILYSILQTPASEIYNCNKFLFSQTPESAPDIVTVILETTQ